METPDEGTPAGETASPCFEVVAVVSMAIDRAFLALTLLHRVKLVMMMVVFVMNVTLFAFFFSLYLLMMMVLAMNMFLFFFFTLHLLMMMMMFVMSAVFVVVLVVVLQNWPTKRKRHKMKSAFELATFMVCVNGLGLDQRQSKSLTKCVGNQQ